MKENKNNHKYNKEKDKQSNAPKDILEEFQIKEGVSHNKFNVLEFLSKNECTSYAFGKIPIEQKGYICSICDKKKKNLICRFCHKFCHEKCRGTLIEDPKVTEKKEKLGFQKFACHCGVEIKHMFDLNIKSNKTNCNMMQLDQELNIIPYHCITHDVIVCCICAVVCHKECTILPEIEVNSVLSCNCISDFHSNFNEMGLSFPLEQYKKISNVDIWPIQILNILFSTGTIFNNMKLFFKKFLTNEIDFKNQNKLVINKFADLLELFSNTFNSKFKTYYYHEEITNMFPYQTLFTFIQNLEVNNEPTCIIKFRLLFILLFIHLRKDFQVSKALTSNDFLCNNVLQRLTMKKLYRNNNIYNNSINDKYKILQGDPIKDFALKELCNLIKNGMKYISIEENQDEFEIGLKILCFMLKKLMFNKEDLILLINSLYNFHENFYEYIMSSKNNIYSLIDIFNAIVEICYIISVNYNDLIIEESLENSKDISSEKFIITKNEHSNKLLVIIFKNCDLFSKHFDILIKPEVDIKSKEEKKREEKLRKHLLIMQQKILSKTTGITQKIPENSGLLKNKIITLFNENLSLFSLTDNLYQKQLEYITEEDLKDYHNFCKKIEDEDFYTIMKMSSNQKHSNILLNLKIVIEEVYFDLFNTSYAQQEEQLEKKLRTRILNACDEINKNIETFSNTSHFSKLIKKLQEKEAKIKKEKGDNNYLEEDEIIKRKILKDISVNINFAKSPFLLTEEGRELLVDNLIVSQIDETLFKGLIFLTNIRFPNIINQELVRLFFHFLGLFLLTKRGVRYILIGKNLKNIQRLINRFRFDAKNKNLVEIKKRSTFFNVHSIKVVIHYLCLISKLIKIYNIKTIIMHKALPGFQKNIIIHIKYFANNIDNEDTQIEFKQQLKECLEIFNNLFEFYTYNEFEYIKFDFIDIFRNCPLKLLSPEIFQKWFDRTTISFDDPVFKKRRKWDLAFYFQFFELISINTFYVYENDEYGKKLIEWLKTFIDIDNLYNLILNSNDLFSFSQKSILFKFIRTYYLVDNLNQVNYLKKNNLLTTDQYKFMIAYNMIQDNRVTQYLIDNKKIKKDDKNNKKNDKNNKKNDKNNDKNNDKTNLKVYGNKYNFINELIILINIYTYEIGLFPKSIIKETNKTIKNYIIELVIATHDLSTIIYYNKDIINKILPHYYKLVINFLKKKHIFLKILNDIEENKKIEPKDYNKLLTEENINEDYEFFINRVFNVFDKDYIYKYIMKNIFDIYKKTKINKDINLEQFLKIYDLFNEANFPPFSLLEIKDYEYFYEEQDEEDNKEVDKDYENLNLIRDNFIGQYKDITSSAFLGIASGSSTNKKIDYAEKYVNLFKSFINSTESVNLTNYRTLLCIMVKLLLYDGEHIQSLFKEFAYDKYFFKNLNRELNYHIVQCINSSKKYELFFGCIKITDITKLTIQFLQLLGEGFNIDFHDNILKGITKEKKTNTKIIEKNENNKDINNNKEQIKGNESEDSDSESINLEINDEIVEKAINMTVKNELNKKRVIPLIDTQKTIYESMIYNLKIIYNLMKLNLLVEGELAYDKLCILSTNIIDFIIEFIDTKKDLIYIIDYYITNLFFGKDIKTSNFPNNSKKGISPVLTLKINDNDEESLNKYKLRKTMMTFMKIKYYQLLKAYLQIGNKNEFVHLMISNRLGPFQLFGEIIYYMKELINNLVSKDYEQYKYLLDIKNVDSYIKKLNNLYIFDNDFSNSIEMRVIFQICLILITFEDMYKITTLKDFFKNEKITEYKKTNDEEDSSSTKESKEDIIVDKLKKEPIKIPPLKIPKNSFPANYRPETYRSENELIEDYYLDTNEQNVSNLNFSPNKPVFQEINDTPYSHLKDNYDTNNNNKKKKEKERKELFSKKNKKMLDEDNLNLDSKFVKAIYLFFCSLISKVEIRMASNEENTNSNIENKKRNNHYKFLSHKISKELIKLKNESKKLSIITDNKKIDNNENNNDNNFEIDDEDEEEEENNGNKCSFFIRPHLSFLLSQQTKDYFINNVDRSHVSNKYSSLISFSDYCIFEMMYNMRYIYKSKIKKRLSQIDLYYIQIINFILIIVENALLMYHYYRSISLSQEEYDVVHPDTLNKRFNDIFIIVIVKLGLIGFVFFIWFYCKFIITYQRNIIFKEEGNFIFRKLGENNQNINQPIMVNFFQNGGSLLDIMGLINRELNILNKIKIALFDSIIANIEINIFVFSFILNLLFLVLGTPIVLSIEAIFLVGIFPSLLNIFRAFTAKFSSLISCLIFTYLMIYVYNWITIFYLKKTFDFGDILEYQSGQYIIEPFCHSSLQCYLVLINYGTRSGGGIADTLPVVSFKNDTNMFIARFFYDMTFYILIIMIMGNITFGLIVDSFGALRDETYSYENDKENVCFICQLTRDGCLLKNIDFDYHVSNEHNIWNYVDFLCYLHLYDSNNFSRIEGFVWDKLIEKDYGWLPINTDAGGDDEEED